ncbi:nucleoside phosphorylase domain-containing protein [Talaromyces proteolyticus]|uniref:Nucleoside phosphorylase domain-containing protein n=1 Tax=Talaromyces proteolyticus TaxID=1131652 RepID=A0AAD4KTS8_9EURO|nr:nucleoside phosphorylase domain-containing protein [Talaromyces proteolyticus]KAH8700708.1 nucleoside phosphorylase domain-containing protein [Talaromyces proteolyticus]
MRPSSRDEFEIAIICSLPLEADAVETLFDESYDKFGRIYGKQRGDTNAYTTGRIDQHNVVLCHMPGRGKRSAASVATSLRVSYTSIKLALVVGICGGVPCPPNNRSHIFLGDIIISEGIIEYDFGRQYPDTFQQKTGHPETLGRPNQEIRSLLSGLKATKTISEFQNRISQCLQDLQAKSERKWRYPGIQHDILYEASYCHKHYQQGKNTPKCICFDRDSLYDISCDEAQKKDCRSLGCERQRILRRRGPDVRDPINPNFHIGTIASADTVMKSGLHRDRLASKDGIIGFEMEGAGIWDSVPAVIIKGVGDYADSHKSKTWQNYAAATASACAKAFLEYWVPTKRDFPTDYDAYTQFPGGPASFPDTHHDLSFIQQMEGDDSVNMEQIYSSFSQETVMMLRRSSPLQYASDNTYYSSPASSHDLIEYASTLYSPDSPQRNSSDGLRSPIRQMPRDIRRKYYRPQRVIPD